MRRTSSIAKLRRLSTAWVSVFLLAVAMAAVASPDRTATNQNPTSQDATNQDPTNRVAAEPSDDVRKSVDASPDGVVQLDGVTGTVSVSGWDRPRVEVTGRLGRGLDSVLLERRGDRVLLRIDQSLLRGNSADLGIRIPAGSRLEVQSMSLDVRVAGLRGGVEANIVSGTQRVTGAGHDSKPVHLETVSGVLQVDGTLGEVELVAVSGPVIVDATLDRLRTDTTNGPQDLRLRGASRVEFDSLNGPIALDLRSPSPRLWASGSTFNGSLQVGLDADTAIYFEASARHGRIENRLGGAETRPERDGYQAVITTRLGTQPAQPPKTAQGSAAGEAPMGATVQVSTYRGDIVLRPLR